MIQYMLIIEVNNSGSSCRLREFGEKIKRLRLAKKISRSEFCGDESELSIRQLIRIENGESRPTLTKLKYIAERLEVEDYKLMPSYIELDKEYLELKYFLMRTPTYEDETIAQKKESVLIRFLKSIMIGYLRKKDLSSQIIHI
ncbi:helix-turn-helix domain-containing protein [Streptococcus pneumoniae]|nr:helix-turn-helix domain-containing protein [Streptococcus pneumoniae]